MGRISASGAQDLYNAYASVYTQHLQEETLTEEQIIIDEFCESWFQQCIDEGVDFSQYSYDVILEAICEAMGQEMGTPTKPSFINRAFNWIKRKLTPSGVVQSVNRGQGNRPIAGNPNRQGGQGRTPVKDFLDSPKQDPMNSPAPTPKPTNTPAATSRPAPNPAATSRPAAHTKPSTPLAHKVAPTNPTAAKSSTSVAGTFKPVPGAPTQQSLATAKPAEKPEQALSKLPGGNYSAAATKLMSQRTKNILGTTKTPATRLGGARERMLNQDLDLFDVVKGHLVSEGYADTEEAALAIMANMSEEWKQSIVESSCGGGHSKPKKKKKSGY